jgi:hypothetical protein
MDHKRKKQEELLAELESIKDLLDSDPFDDAFADPRSPRAAQDKASNLAKEIPVLSELVLDVEPLKEANIKNLKPEDTLAVNVLPGQQSLFEQEKIKKEKEAASQAKSEIKSPANLDQKHDRENTLKSSNERFQNKVNDNPFLPQHIRERLTKSADLEAILAGNNANKRFFLPPIIKTTVDADSLIDRGFFSTNSFLGTIKKDSSISQSLESAINKTSLYKDSSSLSTLDATYNVKPKQEHNSEVKAEIKSQSEATIDLLIDELIAQYLPEIEAKLRFQLKQSLTQKPQKK